MSVYTREIHLRSRDVDLYRRLRTSTLFEFLEDASIRHTEELGVTREKTLDRGLLWMVTLLRAEIRRMPEYDEHITLESWPGETMHLLFPRYYRLLDAAGEPIVSASAIWTLVDAKLRRVVFPDRYGIRIDGETTGHEIALPSPPRLAEGGSTAEFVVPFSYVDLNGHMNNTRYFDLAEDLLPDAARERALREILVEYAGEARLGERMQICVEPDGSAFYLSGETEKRCFRMRFLYE